MNKKKADKCKESLGIMLNHIEMNAKNIILFKTVIAEIDDKITELKKISTINPLQKGTIVLNKPMYFRTQKFIPIIDFNKNQVEQLKHNYSISCWFYVHSQAPNYSSEYNKETAIISYNGEPTIYYFGKTNELIIRSKKIKKEERNYDNSINNLVMIKSKKIELEKIIKDIEKEKKLLELKVIPNVKVDTNKLLNLEKEKRDIEEWIMSKQSDLEDGNNDMVVIYKKPKFKLQKWHNLVVNYIGGVIDVFLDGELVASIDNIVSYKLFNRLTIGEKNSIGGQGIGGGICNIIYYPMYISKARIKSNYNYFKEKNPPTI